MIGNRSWKKIIVAVTKKQHYIAFINNFLIYSKPVENLWRYLTAKGNYPYTLKLKAPIGEITPTLYSHHDLLTVNEVFCRLDYYTDKDVKTVVDIGSNIGISALYFLTRNTTSKCYLFEPDEKNVEKLKKNLSSFRERYVLKQQAVNKTQGVVKFGVEETGRYGGIGVNAEKNIKVEAVTINDLLEEILSQHENIDILKMDIEGLEIPILNSIDREYFGRIKMIYAEAEPQDRIHTRHFTQKQYGTVCQLVNKSFHKKI